MKNLLKYIIRNARLYLSRCTPVWNSASCYQCISGEGSMVHANGAIDNASGARSNIIIGNNTYVSGILKVALDSGTIVIGDSVYIGEGTRIYSCEYVRVGNNVQIAHNCNIFDNNIHSLDPSHRREEFVNNIHHGWSKLYDLKESSVIIKDNAWIGAGVTLLKGVTVGESSIIGAGSVVTEDVPAFTVVVGNPARVIKNLTFEI
jgi:acetyltransferase-like isoleucine patch superfamily enzyme